LTISAYLFSIIPFSNKFDKYAIFITIFFLIIVSVVSFNREAFTENDGIYFLLLGKQLLTDGPSQIKQIDAPLGGPMLYGLLDNLFNDGFFVMKLVSVLSAAGIIFLSYLIIRNLFSPKVALVGQLLFALNPRFDFLSISALNELPSICLIFTSLYFITKQKFKLSDLIITGLFLGISFSIRYQSILVLLGIMCFLLIQNKDFLKNFKLVMLLGLSFLIMISPLLLFNYVNYGQLLVSDSNNYAAFSLHYQPNEFHYQIQQLVVENSNSSWITLDYDLFLKNYFYNLFNNNSSLLFDLDNSNYSLSITPFIPLVSFFIFAIGILHISKIEFNKKNLFIYVISTFISIITVGFLGDFHIHYFAIFICPVIVLILSNFKKIEKIQLIILVLPTVYIVIVSIIPFYRPYSFLPIWIFIVCVYAVFLTNTLPIFFRKIMKFSNHTISFIIILIITILLLTNFALSYGLIYFNLIGEPFINIQDGIYKIYSEPIPLKQSNELLEICDILSKQPNIQEKYVMGSNISIAYCANSKFTLAFFHEGIENDTVNSFIMKKNWSNYDRFYSNIWSFPSLKNYHDDILVDYVVYSPEPKNFKSILYKTNRNKIVEILSDPSNHEIPQNFENIYFSNKTSTAVYKIHHND